MATFNELIAQLNASSDNILANAAKTNIVADDMNQTLDDMGVQEVSGIAGLEPGRSIGDQRDFSMYNSGQLQYTDVAPGDYGYVNNGSQLPEQGIMGQAKNLFQQYIGSGGLMGMEFKGIGSLLTQRSQSDR